MSTPNPRSLDAQQSSKVKKHRLHYESWDHFLKQASPSNSGKGFHFLQGRMEPQR